MAQFVVLPPLSRIESLFIKITNCKFVEEAVWKTWKSQPEEEYAWLYEYIRPSHQKLLIETIIGTQPNPCSLLRQLLRPYNYRIERMAYGWILKYGQKSTSPTPVSVRTGVMVWSEEDAK